MCFKKRVIFTSNTKCQPKVGVNFKIIIGSKFNNDLFNPIIILKVTSFFEDIYKKNTSLTFNIFHFLLLH
jgi:hypothetical protein